MLVIHMYPCNIGMLYVIRWSGNVALATYVGIGLGIARACRLADSCVLTGPAASALWLLGVLGNGALLV